MLELPVRIFLLVGSVVTFAFVISFIRRSRVRIEDTLFWVIICLGFVFISIFPQIAFWASNLLKIASPINLVFVLIIFVLLVNQFYMTIKISQLTIKLRELVQTIAIKDKEEK